MYQYWFRGLISSLRTFDKLCNISGNRFFDVTLKFFTRNAGKMFSTQTKL